MNKLAYSYLRFSTPEQAGGDSRRRQLDLARAYAARHGLVLDAGLSFRDLGMGSVKNLGHYAASWIAGWPNRPSSTAALT